MQVTAIAVFMALVGLVDFYQRVYVPRAMSERDTEIAAVELPAPPLPLARARERLQSWLPAEAREPPEALTGAQVSPQDSAARIPDRAVIGSSRFVLRGVFDAGPPFAVFDVTSSDGGEVEQHQVSAGDAIRGVRVERIAGHRVSLSDGEKTIQLALFIDPENKVAPVDE